MSNNGYDVIVVGLGAMGSAAVHHLAERGVRVLGIEQFGPGHDRGSSHGDSRIIRQAYFEDPSYVPLVQRSYELFNRIGEQTGRRLITRTGGLVIGAPQSGTVDGARKSALAWDLEHTVLTVSEVREQFPTIGIGDEESAVYEPVAGYVVPEDTVRAQIDLAGRAGADLRFGERVESVQAQGGGAEVVTTRGERFGADRLVVCAGAWTPVLLADLGAHVRVERQVMHWLTPDDPTPFRADRHPVYIWEDPDGDLGYGFPVRPGDTAVKAAFFRRVDPADPDRLRRDVTEDETAEFVAVMRRRLPAAGSHHSAAACMYTLSPDRHFVIGTHPDRPRMTVAAGFSGHGFKFAPVVGEVLADLTIDGSTRHDIALFDPERLGSIPHDV